jgi:SAM-dependent methyltransferase
MQNNRCPICGGADLVKVKGAAEPFAILKCRDCLLRFVDPVPAGFQAGPHYDNAYYSDWENAQKPARIKMWKKRLRSIRDNAAAGKLLDIGAGTGLFLSLAREQGFEVFGTEVSQGACEIARQTYDINLDLGELRALNYKDASFDVVTLWHVLEHTKDPYSTLSEVRRILAPGGLFVLAVPNLENVIFQFFYSVARGKMPLLFAPDDREMHFFHFNSRALGFALKKSGFEVLGIKPDLGQVQSPKKQLDFLGYLFWRFSGMNICLGLEAACKKANL